MKLTLFNFKKSVYLSLLIASIFITACDNDTDVVPVDSVVPLGKYESGILISNEGPFQNGSGSITFYDPVSGLVEQNAFETANGRVLGNIVQSVSVHEGNIYTVVNNSGKVEIASAEDFISIGVIEGLTLPRYFLGLNADKAYVSEWGTGGVEGSIKVIDLTTNEIVKTIPVGSGAERMLLVGDDVYVACKGGFGSDNRVFIINAVNDEVIKEIPVGANPGSLQLDAQNNVWVLCEGQFNSSFTALEKSPELYRIDATFQTVTGQFSLDDFNNTASNLVINESASVLYFLKGGSVFAAPTTSGDQLAIETILEGFYYGLGYDPVDQLLFVSDAGDFVSNGSVLLVDPQAGVIDEIPAGIIPNSGFYFSAN